MSSSKRRRGNPRQNRRDEDRRRENAGRAAGAYAAPWREGRHIVTVNDYLANATGRHPAHLSLLGMTMG